mgnify:CR=1 FL=1
MEFFENVGELLTSIFNLILNVLDLLLSSFIDGIQFFASTFTSIPNLIIDLLDTLPGFFQVGLTGIFGLLLFVVLFKLIQLIKIL